MTSSLEKRTRLKVGIFQFMDTFLKPWYSSNLPDFNQLFPNTSVPKIKNWYVLDRWLHSEAKTAGSSVTWSQQQITLTLNTFFNCYKQIQNTVAEGCNKYLIFHFDVKKKKFIFNTSLSLCSSKYYSKSKGKSTISHLAVNLFCCPNKISIKTCIIVNIVTSRK